MNIKGIFLWYGYTFWSLPTTNFCNRTYKTKHKPIDLVISLVRITQNKLRLTSSRCIIADATGSSRNEQDGANSVYFISTIMPTQKHSATSSAVRRPRDTTRMADGLPEGSSVSPLAEAMAGPIVLWNVGQGMIGGMELSWESRATASASRMSERERESCGRRPK